MIISDGVTSLEFPGTTDDELVIEKQDTVTAGGYIRSQTAGVRPTFTEVNVRITQADLVTFGKMMTNGALEYFYTPSQIPAGYAPEAFPMSVSVNVVSKDMQAWGSERMVAHRYTIKFQATIYL